ncbi:MAG TPA: monovalent cation/H(+) antiporter subunit G [Pirellulales bacterium]|nr:monovalent cation/H(+) antiporter subunit G [Pirellulales bacterium]
MTAALDIILVVGVAVAWLGALVFARMQTALERLHVIAVVNIVGGIVVLLGAFLTDGMSSRSLKCTVIWLVMVLSGALVSHVTGRALHLREGERR